MSDILNRAAEIYCEMGLGRSPELVKFSELEQAVVKAVEERLGPKAKPPRLAKGPLEDRVAGFMEIDPDVAYTASPVTLCYVLHDAKRLIAELWRMVVEDESLPERCEAGCAGPVVAHDI